jgi:hypothetical protein
VKRYNLQPASNQMLLAQSITLRRAKHEAHVGKNEKKKYTVGLGQPNRKDGVREQKIYTWSVKEY